ncbi:MAG: flagellar basal body-associated protein FliL [Chloroflexota bacterium]
MKDIIKIVGFVVIGLLIGAGGLFAAVQFLNLPIGNGAVAAEQDDGHKPAPKAGSKKPEPEVHGTIVPLKERIVNLADPGILRYLKTTVVLEIYDPHPPAAGGGGHGAPKKGDTMPEDLKTKAPLIEDHVTTLLTTKTTSELMTAQGKNALKTEIKTALNKALKDDRILAVYFTDFVIQ